MTREEAIEILWRYDVNFEPHPPEEVMHAIDMAIEALQTAEINCVHCPHYHETEDDTGVHGHCKTHGRLIDADALLEAVGRIGLTCDGGVDINDLEGTIQEMADADRPHGEWVKMPNGNIECSECRHQKGWYENFCGFCGADMRGGK